MSRNILITGASSGIGEALALTYAAPETRLVLTGRNRARLEAVAQACTAKGASVLPSVIDVREKENLAAAIHEWDSQFPFDLVIANAGISGGVGAKGGEPEEQVREIFAINLDGVLNTVLPVIPRMKERKRGQIALMSSIISFRGMPQAPAYSGSKGAVRLYGEGLRGELAPYGVGVSVICPGFVRSRITDANDFPMPFFMEADRAAGVIKKGLEKNRSRIAFPFPTYALTWLMAALPPCLTDGLLRLAPRKSALDKQHR